MRSGCHIWEARGCAALELDAVWRRRSKWLGASRWMLPGLIQKRLIWAEAPFPPGLRWIRWGRGFQPPVPWPGPGRATSRWGERGSCANLLARPSPWQHHAQPGLFYAGSGRGGEGWVRVAVPSENAPVLACFPRALVAVVQPKAEAAPDPPGSPAQLWPRASPVLLSLAARPPSPQTGWCNVSGEAPGPTSKPPRLVGGSLRTTASLWAFVPPRGPGSSSTWRGAWGSSGAPQTGSRCLVPAGVSPWALTFVAFLLARLTIAFLRAFSVKWDWLCPAQPAGCCGNLLQRTQGLPGNFTEFRRV